LTLNVRYAVGVAFAVACCWPASAGAELRFGAAETISAPGGSNAIARIDARGNALAVWTQRPSSAMYSWRAPRGRWTRPREVSPAGALTRVEVALSPLGDALAVGYSRRDGLVALSARPDTAFGEAQVIAREPVTIVQMAADDAGNATVAWTHQGAVRVSTRRAGGRWSDPQTLARDPAGLVNVAVHPNGAAAIAWSLSRGPSAPQASFRPPGGSFGPVEDIPIGDQVVAPRVAFAPDGRLVVSGSGMPGMGPESTGAFVVARSPLGEWGSATRIDPGGFVGAPLPEPGGDVSFGLAVADGTDGRTARFVTLRPDGTTAEPLTLSDPDSCDPTFAQNLRGGMLGVWCRNFDAQRSGSRTVVADRVVAGAFGPSTTVLDNNALPSDAALNDAGQAVVVGDHLPTGSAITDGVVQAAVRENPSLPLAPFPPDLDVDVPDVSLGEDGVLEIAVRCDRRCRVQPQGLLFTGASTATAGTGAAKRLARKRGRLRLAFGRERARAVREALAAGRRPSVAATVVARGQNARVIHVSRLVRLRR
jgi:hypothetical protein